MPNNYALLMARMDTLKLTSLPEKLILLVSKDYPEVARIVTEVGYQVRIPPFATEGAKPFTILNLAIANELGVPKQKRIACASVVDSAARSIGVCDDIIDEEIVEMPTALDAFGCHLLITYRLLFDHVKKGIIPSYAFEQIGDLLVAKKSIMQEGIMWQHNHGNLNNTAIRFPEFLEKYVDKIAGGLFEWAVEPIAYYHPAIEDEIHEILQVVTCFSRIFQMKDDMIDVFHDYHKGHLTTSLFFIRKRKAELTRLASKSKDYAISEEEFKSWFPNAYEDLQVEIRKEEDILLRKLRSSPISMTYRDLLQMNRIYSQLRKQLEDRLLFL